MYPPRRTLRRYAAAVVLVCFTAALTAQTQKWKSYSYAEDGFRASFPSAPQVDTKSQPAGAGPIEFHSYCAQQSYTYLCVAVFVHGSQATGMDPDTLMERIKLGVLAGDKTKKLSETPIALGDHKGVALEAENDVIHTSTRIYLVGDTVYQTLVTSPVASKYADTTQFLDSFRLISRVQR